VPLCKNYQRVWDLTPDAEDSNTFADYIIDTSPRYQVVDTKTFLHPGCGSWRMDFHRKMHFEVIGLGLYPK
jgi:hypothetical protein